MAIVKKYNLDKDNTKKDIIEHFKSLDRYAEWDFDQEGSAVNLLMEILAYNASQNAFVSNRLASELLLETCQKRQMAVSNAYTLGAYLPHSAQAARTEVGIKINSFGDSDIPEYIIINKGHKFTADNGFEFFTIEQHVMYPDTNGFATLSGIDIYEGRRVTFTSSGAGNGFVISNENADLSTLNISVNGTNAKQVGVEIDIAEVVEDSVVYYIKENFEGRYEVSFGDGYLGKQTDDSDILVVDYIIAENLDEANGLINFTTDPIDGFTDITITADVRTHSGSVRETVESIKRNAPQHFSAANRAVNYKDYRYLIERNFPFVKAAATWGGEENKTYGNVFFSAINHNNEDISLSQVSQIQEFLKDFAVGSISSQYVTTKIVDIYPVINIVLDPKKIDYSVNNAKLIVQEAINKYASSISGFETQYSSTDLSNFIENDLAGLRYIKIENRINKFVPFVNTVETEINFEMPLYHPFDGFGKEKDGVLVSTEIIDPKTRITYFINDDGYGNLRRYYNNSQGERVYVNDKQGTVNYVTGKIKIDPFNGLGSSSYTIRATPGKDIIESSGNTILRLTGQNAIIVIETNV